MIDFMTDIPRPGDQPARTHAGMADISADAQGPSMGEAEAQAVFDAAAVRYFADRRARVPAFVDRYFSLSGSLRLHRRAIGWDMARAPYNLTMAVPMAAAKFAAATSRAVGARSAAHWLESRSFFLDTDVGREIVWLVQTDLLELPFKQGDRISTRDALAEAMFADPRVDAVVADMLMAIGRRSADREFRSRLTDALTAYTGARTAASEIATALVTIGVGAVAFKQMTPGMLSLGPTVAAAIAHQSAIAAFPLGSGLGAAWYGLFPAAASPALLIGVTGGMMAAASCFAAFAGILSDPIQRRLGLHQRRLIRFVDVLERNFSHPERTHFVVRDHYVARLLDVLDIVRTAHRLAV